MSNEFDPKTKKLFDVTVNAQATAPPKGIPSGVWATGAPILWEQKIKGKNVTVGVIDSGIDRRHPDLENQVKLARDYVGDGASIDKWEPHGTHVAGIIAANGKTITGVAPEAKLIDYRVLGIDGSGTNGSIVQAIYDSVKDGCDIINLSLGGSFDYPPMHAAIKYAVKKGVLVVAAVGNEGKANLDDIKISYPGFYPEVVGVGAVEFDISNGKVLHQWFSNKNKEVDVCADGHQVYSTFIGEKKYAELSGTSMAAPHVAGFAALILSKARRQLSEAKIEEAVLYRLLKTSTVDVAALEIDSATGAGFVTAYPELPVKQGSTWSLPHMNPKDT